jgi:hypothetical protein
MRQVSRRRLAPRPGLAKPRKSPHGGGEHPGGPPWRRSTTICFPLSPFGYLAGLGLEEIAARRGAHVVYKPVQLFRIFEATGTPMVKDRHVSRQRYRLQDIARVARRAGCR